MPFDQGLGNVTYFGSFVWMYGIKRDLWEAAMRSYQKNIDKIDKPHLITLIDFRIPRNRPRLWTLNFSGGGPQLVEFTLVAHGKGSGPRNSPECERVGRLSGSNMSCVGGFVTKHIYQSGLGQKDKSKKRPAMVVEGLDPTNDNARNRGIRMHGAYYVKKSGAGRSHGCICCRQEVHEALIKVINGGSFMFSYFGEDSVEV